MKVVSVLFGQIIRKTASEGTTAEDGATEATVNTDDAVEQSAQDFGEQGADTNGTEFEQMEGVNTEQKLIKTVNMSAETTEFDTLVADVRAKAESAGGYVEKIRCWRKLWRGYNTLCISCTSNSGRKTG